MASIQQTKKTESTYVNGDSNALAPNSLTFGEPISEADKRVTEEEYWAKYYEHPDFSYEWNNGILEEKPMPDPINVHAYRWFLIILDMYFRVNPIGQLMHLETAVRFSVALSDIKIRKPDAFVVLHDNPDPLAQTDRSYRGTCDLAIESLSDSTEGEVKRDTETKFDEYRLAGVKEYFLLDAKSEKRTAFYRLGPNNRYQEITPVNGDIIESTVLPGFKFRISDLFTGPSLVQLSEDEVYQGYILLEYQESQRRLAEESTRANSEKQRADSEKQQKEQMAEFLRNLGYDPDNL